jgi:hypothetical protein
VWLYSLISDGWLGWLDSSRAVRPRVASQLGITYVMHIASMMKDVPQSSHIHPNEKHSVVRYVLENVYIIPPDEVGGHNALKL